MGRLLPRLSQMARTGHRFAARHKQRILNYGPLEDDTGGRERSSTSSSTRNRPVLTPDCHVRERQDRGAESRSPQRQPQMPSSGSSSRKQGAMVKPGLEEKKAALQHLAPVDGVDAKDERSWLSWRPFDEDAKADYSLYCDPCGKWV